MSDGLKNRNTDKKDGDLPKMTSIIPQPVEPPGLDRLFITSVVPYSPAEPISQARQPMTF